MNSGETPVRDASKERWDAPHLEAQLAHSPPTALPPPELRARRHTAQFVIALAIIVFLYSVSWHTEQAPTFALVVRDDAAKVYLSPSCALGRGELPISTLGSAKQEGFRPDPACEKSGGFLGSTQTVMQEALSRVYLYPKRGTRWRPDGTWKW